jgi:putative membrane protein
MPFLLIIAIALAVLTAVFAIQNSDVIEVSFLGWEWEASLALILILTLGVGILVGYLAGLPGRVKKGSQLRQARKDLAGLEELATDLEPAPDFDDEVSEVKE